METKKNIEPWLDAAASEAIGASTPAESATYQQELASGDETARRIDRELRETVARIAAASPGMMPPADLRGRILQATAPATFKMEDYRKAHGDGGRFYRWGFYAAVLFLMVGATYNVLVKDALKKSNSEIARLDQQKKQMDAALQALVSPASDTVWFKENGKVIGRALVNETTHQAVVILPKEMIPDGKTVQLTLPHDGKKVTYDTVLVTAPANTISAPSGRNLETLLTVETMQPEQGSRTSVAGQ